MQVVVKPLVIQKLDELFIALLEKGYFADISNAKAYRKQLEDFVHLLPQHKHRCTKNKRWGEFYATYRANRRTSWYITFDTFEGIGYIVRNIFNNHSRGYAHFVGGVK